MRIPDPVVVRDDGDPAHEAELADAVGLAMLVVLETLSPPERLAFVLHDMFAVPFDEIAVMLERSPDATRQLASRARRRVQDAPAPTGDRAGRRRVVDAFYAAARGGDFDALVAVLDPDDRAAGRRRTRGPARRRADRESGDPLLGPDATCTRCSSTAPPAVYVEHAGRPIALMVFTVVDDRVAEIDIINDPERLVGLDLLGG